jgi:hypothetical protein
MCYADWRIGGMLCRIAADNGGLRCKLPRRWYHGAVPFLT